jgi:DNA-binding XRE family transcriptional regulator
MMPKRWPPPRPKQRNGQRRFPPVELLSARIFRLRIARGYSVYELATAAGVFAGTIKCLESGKPADKRVLPALARALGVPICRLVCGEHNCVERACVPARSHAGDSSGVGDRRVAQ